MCDIVYIQGLSGSLPNIGRPPLHSRNIRFCDTLTTAILKTPLSGGVDLTESRKGLVVIDPQPGQAKDDENRFANVYAYLGLATGGCRTTK